MTNNKQKRVLVFLYNKTSEWRNKLIEEKERQFFDQNKTEREKR
jgi:hypothetical protein